MISASDVEQYNIKSRFFILVGYYIHLLTHNCYYLFFINGLIIIRIVEFARKCFFDLVQSSLKNNKYTLQVSSKYQSFLGEKETATRSN